MTTVDSDKPPNTVVHVLQKGYQLHDRVLRPALVTVAKPKHVNSRRLESARAPPKTSLLSQQNS